MNKKILNNTLLLYTRQILLILVNLYGMRVLLKTLGIEEYAVYTVVAGVILVCSFMPASLASATQRFFSFALGKKDQKLLNQTFSVNLVVYSAICLISLSILLSIGLYAISNFIKIPLDTLPSAKILYNYTVVSFVFSIITSPFIAIIIAHEDMKIYAWVSILEATLKLIIIISLPYIPFDKLEVYGFLLMINAILVAIIYLCICLSKYSECQFKKNYWSKELFLEMSKFTGWTIFGQLSTVARSHAITILFNQFFTPAVVASRAIANSISSQVLMFSNNFNTSLYPPIVKSFACDKGNEFSDLIIEGSKLTFFLTWVLLLPIMVEMPFILSLWLGNAPEEAIVFSRLALAESLIVSVSLPLATAARASGRVKLYELALGSLQFCILVLAYVFVRNGSEPVTVYVIAIIVTLFMFFVRISIVSYLTKFSIRTFIRRAVLPILLVFCGSLLLTSFVKGVLPNGWFFSALVFGTSFFVSCFLMYVFGLSEKWKLAIRVKIKNLSIVGGRR